MKAIEEFIGMLVIDNDLKKKVWCFTSVSALYDVINRTFFPLVKYSNIELVFKYLHYMSLYFRKKFSNPSQEIAEKL